MESDNFHVNVSMTDVLRTYSCMYISGSRFRGQELHDDIYNNLIAF